MFDEIIGNLKYNITEVSYLITKKNWKAKTAYLILSATQQSHPIKANAKNEITWN